MSVLEWNMKYQFIICQAREKNKCEIAQIETEPDAALCGKPAGEAENAAQWGRLSGAEKIRRKMPDHTPCSFAEKMLY